MKEQLKILRKEKNIKIKKSIKIYIEILYRNKLISCFKHSNKTNFLFLSLIHTHTKLIKYVLRINL